MPVTQRVHAAERLIPCSHFVGAPSTDHSALTLNLHSFGARQWWSLACYIFICHISNPCRPVSISQLKRILGRQSVSSCVYSSVDADTGQAGLVFLCLLHSGCGYWASKPSLSVYIAQRMQILGKQVLSSCVYRSADADTVWASRPCLHVSIAQRMWIYYIGKYPILGSDTGQADKFISTRHMIQDIYILHWNIIHKSIRVAWNVGPYKLIDFWLIGSSCNYWLTFVTWGVPLYKNTITVSSIVLNT